MNPAYKCQCYTLRPHARAHHHVCECMQHAFNDYGARARKYQQQHLPCVTRAWALVGTCLFVRGLSNIQKPTHYTVYHYAAISSQMTITQPDWQCLKAAVSSGQMAATNTASY